MHFFMAMLSIMIFIQQKQVSVLPQKKHIRRKGQTIPLLYRQIVLNKRCFSWLCTTIGDDENKVFFIWMFNWVYNQWKETISNDFPCSLLKF